MKQWALGARDRVGWALSGEDKKQADTGRWPRGRGPLRPSAPFMYLPPHPAPRGLSPSRVGMTVFLKARTSPSGHPKRKRSAMSKSNFPMAPVPSSMVALLEQREPGSCLSTLAWRLQAGHVWVTPWPFVGPACPLPPEGGSCPGPAGTRLGTAGPNLSREPGALRTAPQGPWSSWSVLPPALPTPADSLFPLGQDCPQHVQDHTTSHKPLSTRRRAMGPIWTSPSPGAPPHCLWARPGLNSRLWPSLVLGVPQQ